MENSRNTECLVFSKVLCYMCPWYSSQTRGVGSIVLHWGLRKDQTSLFGMKFRLLVSSAVCIIGGIAIVLKHIIV